MGIFALLTLLSGLLMGLSSDSNGSATEEDLDTTSDPDVTDAPTPDNPTTDDPEIMLDTGATFDHTEEGVVIDVGDDETGTLVVLYYKDFEDTGSGVDVVTDEARYYLVPEGIDWSGVSFETQSDIPGLDTFDGGSGDYLLEDFEVELGLELLGVVDLIGTPFNHEDPGNRVGDVTSNQPIEEYFLGAQTDGDELISFYPVDYVITRGGAEEVSVDSDTTGTDENDWISIHADGVTVDGAGGNDYLETSNSHVTILGGQGDDTIRALGADAVIDAGDGNDEIRARGGNVTVDGGAGDDWISTRDSVTATGGDGNDSLFGSTGDSGPALLYGNAGNDEVTVYGAESQGFGGDGADYVTARQGATIYGGQGDDLLELDSGSTAYGGDGDDLFTFWNYFNYEHGSAVVTGGAGADTFDVRLDNASERVGNVVNMTITDFDPTEDVLQIGATQSGNQLDDIEISEAADGSYTDVRVNYIASGGNPPEATIVRLEGTTGFTADQIVVIS